MIAALLLATLVTAPPEDYVVSKLAEHRVVIVGEPHWLKQDVQLVTAIVPRLRAAGVYVLGYEFLRGSDQAAIDQLVNAETWNEGAALALFRRSSWPYREYVDVVKAVWQTNRGASAETRLRLVALGPDPDFREKKIDYEQFGAQKLIDVIGDRGGTARALVYCGFHHGFTRFVQPWLPEGDGKPVAFFDRMGNILRRKLGDTVFLVAMHHPWRCRVDGKWTSCLPLDGALDCAMKEPGGFDVATSPFAEARLDAKFWYALGTPLMRFVDLTDGYVRLRPLEKFETVTLIPLAEFAPDDAALEEVRQNNPFSSENLEEGWAKRAAWLSEPLASRDWAHLREWRSRCR
jgi:hypothetical protein